MVEYKIYINFDEGKVTTDGEYQIINQLQRKTDTKLAIVGSRTITDVNFVNRIFNCYKYCFGKPKKVISGGAKGIDTIGETWADNLKIEKQIFIPDWDKYGKKAGFIRNEDIIKNCDVCLAIWDGGSNGTKNDFELCEKYKKSLILFNMKEFKSGSFSGFSCKFYSEDDLTQPEASKPLQNQNKYNRWLPQPGIIKM